ncbi:uncharacterized protein BXIN_2450 [Babesia sp. Xinjiang]|uniref:uncharacterized protein n=1 Tax=Babesia sp. Xinjiang TaxID=462227 RepID=UPI000A2271F0|nr:uncharacterized protein BXIN_2450 [Babesia sp. Xinjiang]ORM41432.1 hypothetical protein BXIN_2450 [Babesia sp. Xinjiang]
MWSSHLLQICFKILLRPVTTACGHNFCKTCVDQVFSGEHTSSRMKRMDVTQLLHYVSMRGSHVLLLCDEFTGENQLGTMAEIKLSSSVKCYG